MGASRAQRQSNTNGTYEKQTAEERQAAAADFKEMRKIGTKGHLQPCPTCQRTFSPEALKKHILVCRNNAPKTEPKKIDAVGPEAKFLASRGQRQSKSANNAPKEKIDPKERSAQFREMRQKASKASPAFQELSLKE